jgi:hypothetical protein
LEFAKQCIQSVVESDYQNLEVIVVDNGSTDGSYEIVCQLFNNKPNVKIVRNPRNLGFAEGNNIGCRHCKGAIIVFLNVDTKVEPDWLKPLVSNLLSDDRIGGAQCKLLDMKNRERIDSLGSSLDVLGYVYPNRSGPLGEAPEIFYSDGAAMAFKREVLNQVSFDGNPFDSNHLLYYEDSDLCWRVRLRGYKIVLALSSVVYHYRGGAGGRDLGHARTCFFTASHLLTLIKNYDLRNLALYMPALVLMEMVQSAILLLSEPRRSVAKVRAFLWCLRNLRSTWIKRLYVQTRVRRIPDREVMRLMRRPNLLAARADASVFY